MTTVDDHDPQGYEWAKKQLQDFIETIEASKAWRARDSKEPTAKVKQMVPVVREILLRLDPTLADFKVGALTGWDAAENAAHAGIGVISARVEVAGRMGPALPRLSGPDQWHPTILGASRKLLDGQHHQEAVTAAAEQLVQSVQALTGRSELPSGTDVWRQAFSKEAPEPRKPRLRWPGDPRGKDVQNMNSGLRDLSVGLQMTVRNPAAHPRSPMSREEAVERLTALSLLAGLVEQCELDEVSETAAEVSE